MLSKVVNALIGITPIYSVMKVAAKQVLVDTANKNGIPWQETVREFQKTPEVRVHARSVSEIALVDGCPQQHLLQH